MDNRANTPPAHNAAPPGAAPAPGVAPRAVVLSTGSLFHLPLPVIARVARAAGFHGLDLVMGSPAIAPGAAVDEAHCLCPVRVVHAPFRNWSAWGGHKGAWCAAVDLARALLAPANDHAVHVTLHPPAGTLHDAVQTRWFSRAVDLPRLLDAPPGVSLSLENLPWAAGSAGLGLFSRDPLAVLIHQCQEKGLGLTLDVCHLGVSGRSVLDDLARVPVELVRHVHFSDALGFAEHLPPGRGELPLGPFLAGLGAAGYAGTVSLELDPAHLPEDEAGLVRELARLRQGMERALAADAPPDWSGQGAGNVARSARPRSYAALG